MNSSIGADSVQCICIKSTDDLKDMALRPYKSIEDALSKSTGYIGFAIPMASRAFKAVRFSVTGAATAIKEAERVANQRSKAKQKPINSNSGYF
jgi:hypothetical protein